MFCPSGEYGSTCISILLSGYLPTLWIRPARREKEQEWQFEDICIYIREESVALLSFGISQLMIFF